MTRAKVAALVGLAGLAVEILVILAGRALLELLGLVTGRPPRARRHWEL